MKSKFNWVLILAPLILILFLLADYFGKLSFLTTPARKFFSSFQNGFMTIGELAYSPVSFLQFINSGEKRIIFLERRNLDLQAKMVLYEAILKENSELKKQLGEEVTEKNILIVAKVLGLNRYLQIEAENSKISPGQSVIYLNNLIGRIEKKDGKIAYVLLTTDHKSVIPARAANFATGIVTGAYASKMSFELVGKTEIVQIQDLIITSGLDRITPEGIVLGKVEKVVASENELFQKFEVVPLFDIRKLTNVFIIVD